MNPPSRVAIIASTERHASERAASVVAPGVEVRPFDVDSEAIAAFATDPVDVVVLDVGSDPERFAALVTQLPTEGVPRIVVTGAEVAFGRIAPLGPTTIVLDDPTGKPLATALSTTLASQRAVRQAHTLARRFRKLDAERASLVRTGAVFDHDARILLGVVVGYGANLRDGFAGPLDEATRRHIASILDAAEDLTSLIGRHAAALRALPPANAEGLDAELSAAGGPRLPRRVLADLVDLVRPIVGMFESLAAARQVELRFVDRSALPVWCDATQIKQVVTNLLHNGLKFTPSGGKIEVVVREASYGRGRAAAVRTVAELIVSDTGPGIAIEDRERVFEPGTRLARDAAVPGTGLGLAVVKDVVGRHGGTVRIETSESGGASFVVTLPTDRRRRRDAARLRATDTGDAR